MRMNARQLREVEETELKGKLEKIKRNPIFFILENVYDTYNVGGLFRLADALAIEKMYLCGEMEIPPNSKIKKASIGTYKVVPWEYKKTAKEAIESLSQETRIIAVEQHPQAVKYTKANYSIPLALVFGNETSGVSEETLPLADQIVEIPMWGINKSLNVIVSAAIVSYWAIRSLIQDDFQS